MTTTKTITVTNQLPSGSTFAVTGGAEPQQVYIPASVAKACGLNVGKSYAAQIVPNAHETADKTPWLAIRVDALQDEPEPDHIDVQVAFAEHEYPMSADDLGLSDAACIAAWRAGYIVKVTVQTCGDTPDVMWTDDKEKV